MNYGQVDNSLLARARRASSDQQKLALYYELVSALAGHEYRELSAHQLKAGGGQ